MIIRNAGIADLEQISNIHVESWLDSYSDIFSIGLMNKNVIHSLKNHWKSTKINDDDIVLVAEEKEIVAFIAIWCQPVPFIDNLHVKPSYRSQNIGTTLMKNAARTLLANGKRTAYLWVFNNNERAIRFYERLGGHCEEYSDKVFFGQKVTCMKMIWNDLTLV